MNETLPMNARFSPWMAVPINVTVRMPITMPRVVRTERILLARIAAHEMPRPSLSSVRKFISRAGSSVPMPFHNSARHNRGLRFRALVRFGMCGGGRGLALIAGDQTVTNADNPPRVSRNVFLVRNHNDRVPLSGKLGKQREDLRAGLGIEVPGGFISKQN